jgi:hypothetical protein
LTPRKDAISLSVALKSYADPNSSEESIMSNARSDKRIKMIRLPDDLANWLEKQASYNGGTLSTEIARHFRKLMEADAKAKARAETAGAP